MIFLRPNNFFEFFIQFLINTIFRFRQSINKRLIKKVENNIFISGEFFEKISRENSSIVFSSLDRFPLKKDYSKYKKKIWVFHNSDETFNLNTKKKLDYFHPKKCFSQNLIINKKNYYFIPIGLENSKFHKNGDIKDFLRLRRVKLEKKPRILFGFRNTNPKRVQLKHQFKKLKITDETNGWNSFFYRRILLNYMFVICPEGNGIDTHRMWEALYLRTIPIIKKNMISNFIKKAKIPVLILNKW